MIQYLVEEGEWVSEREWRKANIDTFTPVVILLRTRVRTSRVRIVPVSHHPRTVCLRVEVCGCQEDLAGEVHDESDNIPSDNHGEQLYTADKSVIYSSGSENTSKL